MYVWFSPLITEGAVYLSSLTYTYILILYVFVCVCKRFYVDFSGPYVLSLSYK